MPALNSLDAHAHIATDVTERELRVLRSVVFAVTRHPEEWELAAQRRDDSCVWGLGCHPSVPDAVAAFDSDRLEHLLSEVALIGEVGLDARSSTDRAAQRRVFSQVLALASRRPRLLSVHSVGATGEVIDLIREQPSPGVILHWWRGSAQQTQEAVSLGCYFSLNGAEVARPKVLSIIPGERVLTETDFPHTKRQDKTASRPGAVETTERALANAWSCSVDEARHRIWANFADLCGAAAVEDLLPRNVQAQLLTLL